MNILIVRNDKLGDFVLSLPSFALLKACMPDATIYALVPEYTSELAQYCPFIDKVIIDKHLTNPISDIISLQKELSSHNFDSIISIYSTTRVGLAALLTGIKYRLAPATKVAQIFYNHRLEQRRSYSKKPEYEYNLDLIRTFLSDHGIHNPSVPEPPFLSFDHIHINKLRNQFNQKFNIPSNNKLIFLHAGSGGSANNLNLKQYAELAANLKLNDQYSLVLTAGPGEHDKIEALSNLLDGIPHIVFHSKQGLVSFAQHIAFSDLFISGSTGTLHIAGALNIPTVAFYTRRRSATPLRWQTLNTPERRLAFTPPASADEMDMSQIDINAAASEINEKFLKG